MISSLADNICTQPSPEEIDQFLQDQGWSDAKRFSLPQDCSTRYYIRLLKNGESRLLMVDPPPLAKLSQYIAVATLLSKHGFRTPQIFAHDDQHLALIEDFGDTTFTQWLSHGFPLEPLYEVGIDILIKLRQSFTGHISSIKTYSPEVYLKELERFSEWYYPALMGKNLEEKAFKSLCHLFVQAITKATQKHPQTVALWDFHIDNMMILGPTPTVNNCGLLDFQDALNGPCAYDLTSLLQDSRYLNFIPRLWENIDTNLNHPLLEEIRRWMDDYIPKSQRQISLSKFSGTTS